MQITLKEPLRKAAKSKRDLLRQILQSVRDTCADPLPGFERSAEQLTKKVRLINDR